MFSSDVSTVLQPGISQTRERLLSLIDTINQQSTVSEADTMALKLTFNDYLMRFDMQAKLHDSFYQTTKSLIEKI